MKERERSTGSIILNRLPIWFLPPEQAPQVQGSLQLKVGKSQIQMTALTREH
jgi:multidrug efflux pump subunit AcrB